MEVDKESASTQHTAYLEIANYAIMTADWIVNNT